MSTNVVRDTDKNWKKWLRGFLGGSGNAMAIISRFNAFDFTVN